MNIEYKYPIQIVLRSTSGLAISEGRALFCTRRTPRALPHPIFFSKHRAFTLYFATNN
jgi:hypothetical protein